MTVVVSLASITPPARYDNTPWTTARIEEAATAAGSYTLIDTVTLDPVDDDPANPDSRDFTTTLGTAAAQFYRVQFRDDDGFSSPYTPVVQNTTATTAYATAAELARLLKVDATVYATQLAEVLLAAAGEINSEIGRTSLAGWELALASQVNLERAAEHWKQRSLGFGIIGLDSEVPLRLARDTWDRHAHVLAPLKESWGIA